MSGAGRPSNSAEWRGIHAFCLCSQAGLLPLTDVPIKLPQPFCHSCTNRLRWAVRSLTFFFDKFCLKMTLFCQLVVCGQKLVYKNAVSGIVLSMSNSYWNSSKARQPWVLSLQSGSEVRRNTVKMSPLIILWQNLQNSNWITVQNCTYLMTAPKHPVGYGYPGVY